MVELQSRRLASKNFCASGCAGCARKEGHGQTDMPKDSLYRQFGKYSGLTFLIPACVLIGYTIGYFLDKAFGTSFLKIVFLLLGVAAGLIELVRELNKDDAETK
jgi:F0F1-type ATP synthase assembly protein I